MTTVAYLEVHFRAHGLAVGDDDLTFVLAFPVPTVELNTTASGKQDLYIKVHQDQSSCF